MLPCCRGPRPCLAEGAARAAAGLPGHNEDEDNGTELTGQRHMSKTDAELRPEPEPELKTRRAPVLPPSCSFPFLPPPPPPTGLPSAPHTGLCAAAQARKLL